MTNPASQAKGLRRCVSCGQADLQCQIRTEQWEEVWQHEKVPLVAEGVPVLVCPACGEVFSGSAAWSIRDEARRRALVLRTAAQLRGNSD